MFTTSAVGSEIRLLPNLFGFLLPKVLSPSLNCCCTFVGSSWKNASGIARGRCFNESSAATA